MPARGYSVSNPRKPRAKARVRTTSQQAAARRLEAQVTTARAKVKAGKGPKADTGDVTKGAAKPTVAERRRATGALYPSGRQSALSQIVRGQSEQTRRRDEALAEFDRKRPAIAPNAKVKVTSLKTGKRVEAKAKDLHITAPREERASLAAEGGSRSRARRSDITGAKLAPAIKVLDQTLRPVRASAGAADALVTGHPERAPGAVKRGLIDNKGPTYSDVLKHAGAPKGVAGPAGLALDVALDPTTYVTLGASAPAKALAAQAAKKATREAAAKGVSKKAADRAGRAAAKVVLSDPAAQKKGIQLGVRAKVPFSKKPGIDVKTSGRSTAAISRATGLSKAATKVRESAVVQRHAPELIHDFRPAGVTTQGHARTRAAARELRAETSQARRGAERKLAALHRQIPDQQTARGLIDHIQSGAPLKDLGELAPVARQIRSLTGRDFDAKRAAALLQTPYRARPEKLGETVLRAADTPAAAKVRATGRKVEAPSLTVGHYGPSKDAKRFVPNVRRIDLEANRQGLTRPVAGRTKAKTEHQREFRQPHAVLRETHPALFSEDLPKVLAHSHLKARENVAVANYWRKVSKTGRPLNRQTAKDIDLTDEMVFEVTPRGLEPLVLKGNDKAPDMKAIAAAADGPAGKHVILSRDKYERLLAETAGESRVPLGKTLDRAQGAWKTAVTTTPGFHVRNLVGDSLNAYTADTTTRAFGQARGLLVSKAHRNKAERTMLSPADTSKTITIGGKQFTHREFIREAEQHGAIDQGFMAAEVGSQANRSPGRIMRGLQYREDLPRLATYVSARERGMSPSEAAGHVAAHHFDYGDLTRTEKNIRRYGVPFWTFFARNTRLQATKVITRPGKSATLAKVMEESAKAAGFKDYDSFAEQLPDSQQRGLPIPIKMGGKVISWTYTPPATDLNALSANPKDFAQNVASRITAAKLAAELYANYSVFFQGPIERENAKLVPAPSILGDLPESVRDRLGVHEFRDKRRGMIWGWPGKLDYVARQLPQTNLLIQSLTPVPGSRGKSGAQSAIGTATGFRPAVYRPAVEDERIRREAKKLNDLTTTRNNLLRTPEARDEFGFASPKLVGLRAEVKAQEAKLERLKTKRGDDTAEQRVDNPPLTPREEMAQEIAKFREEAATADPGGEMRKEIEEFRREQAYLRKQRGG